MNCDTARRLRLQISDHIFNCELPNGHPNDHVFRCTVCRHPDQTYSEEQLLNHLEDIHFPLAANGVINGHRLHLDDPEAQPVDGESDGESDDESDGESDDESDGSSLHSHPINHPLRDPLDSTCR